MIITPNIQRRLLQLEAKVKELDERIGILYPERSEEEYSWAYYSPTKQAVASAIEELRTNFRLLLSALKLEKRHATTTPARYVKKP